MRQIRRFDMRALFAAVDEARQTRSLSWVELTREVNKPFEGTPSIPISVSTLRSIPGKRSVTSAVVLQVLRWLVRAPESFLSGSDDGTVKTEVLPEPGPSRILRFDTQSMYLALDAERTRRGLTWKQVARELGGFSENMLRSLANGPLIGFPRVMAIPQWLDRPASSFVRARSR